MSDDMNRIFLWCIPRTVSTALLKCLSFAEGTRVVIEPYETAFHSGPERKSQTPDLTNPVDKRLVEILDPTGCDEDIGGFEASVCTYGYVRDELLQASYKDTKILFCKDMVFYLDAKYHMLPTGFKYSFLIRHPAKVFSSWKKSLKEAFGESCSKQTDDITTLPAMLFPVGFGFKELYELLKYVEFDLHQEAVVLDIDDLLADPPGILSAYCLKMGIPYKPELLSWEAVREFPENWVVSKTMVMANKRAGFFGKAFQSTGFYSPEPPPAFESLPEDVQVCVKASMGYYDKLREKRIRPLSDN